MKRDKRIVLAAALVILLGVTAGCSSAPIDRDDYQIDPYLKYGRVSLFPPGLTKAIRDIDLNNGDPHEIKRLLCDGTKAKYLPKVTINYHHVDTQGHYIDKANQLRAERLNLVRFYLKQYYFALVMGVLDHPYPGLNPGGNYWEEYEKAFKESVGPIPRDSVLDIMSKALVLRLPLETIRKVFGISDRLMLQHLGWGWDSGRWEASNAAQNQGFIWVKYTMNLTRVSEAAMDDRTIRFEVELPLDLMCETGVVEKDLISK